MVSDLQVKKIATLLKVMADETRLKILLLLSAQEMAVCELINTLGLSQPAVSHHLKILKQAGLVVDKREGKWIFYTANRKNLNRYSKMLQEKLFLPLQEKLVKGTAPSPIREKPGLCEELKAKCPSQEGEARSAQN